LQSKEYHRIPSALRLVPHDDPVPELEPLEKYTLDSELQSEGASPEAGTSTRNDQGFSAYSTIKQHLITQNEFNDLVRDMDLPKTKAQLLGSRPQQWNLLEKSMKVALCRNRQAKIINYFSLDGDLVYCKNVRGLMEEFQLKYSADQWRLFIDSSKLS
jgi:hypothetical protein